MGPKYEFTEETMHYEGYLLHQIKRLSDGKLGGWIESEDNLSQEGNCFVYNDAKVYDNAMVYDNAQVYGNAEVCNNAQVYGNAYVHIDAKVYGNAQVYDDAYVTDRAEVYGHAIVYEDAEVSGKAKVYSDASIHGNAKVYGDARIYGYAEVFENARVKDNAEVFGNAHVFGEAFVKDNAKINSHNIVYCGLTCNNEYYEDEKGSSNEVIQDFIYKVDDSNKITTQTEYDSVDEFFSESVTNDIKLDTLVICTVDTKEPLIKLQKIEIDNKINFKFIVEITNSDGDDFIIRTTIKSQDQLNELIQQTVEALKLYPKFSKYADTLEECL